MRRFDRRSAVAGVVAALACFHGGAGASVAQAKEISRFYDESFTVEPGAILRLEHGDGDVTVTPWDRNEIHVFVRYEADISRIGWGSDPDFRVEFRQDDNLVRVVGKEDGSHVRGGGLIVMHASRVKEYSYVIRVPTWIELECRGEDGNVSVEGLKDGVVHWRLDDGDLELRDMQPSDTRLRVEDGDVFLASFEGPVVLEVEDGDISLLDCRSSHARIVGADGKMTLRQCTGDFSIRLEDGDLRGRQLTTGSLDVRSQDGDVELEILPNVPLDVDIETDDGDVVLHLADGVSAEYLAATEDGRVRVELEARDQDVGRHRAYGVLADGQGQIRIRTQDGGVRLDGKLSAS